MLYTSIRYNIPLFCYFITNSYSFPCLGSSFQYQTKQKHSEERRDKEASSSDFSHCMTGCVVLRSVFLSKLENNKRYIVYLDHR